MEFISRLIQIWERARFSAALALLGFVTIFGAIFHSTCTAAKTAQAAETPRAAVSEIEIRMMIARYARSIDAADAELASQIWSQTTEVSFIHPLGHEHNLEQIEQNVYHGLMGGMFSERKLSPRNIFIHVYGDAAWAEFDWDFTAKLRKDSTLVNTHGRETQIYRKEPTGWRLVHVHYSAMPPSQSGGSGRANPAN